MKKYKICVYAISKNEEGFVDRWYDSVKEADKIIVLDTGSVDNTIKKLKAHDIEVYQEEIVPWRFDTARNKSLELVPKDTDICVCIDLDEVIEPGWRDKLENLWDDKTTRLKYNYNWLLDKNNKPQVNFYIEKIHSRNDYKWAHPVHEILENINNNECVKTTDEITINHYPDKNKSRSSYLNLLELSVKEDPTDDRNMHYLGREYMYNKRYEEAINTLIKHLSLEKATWKDERSASMRFISRCYRGLQRYDEAKIWLDKAIKETPYLREAYVEKAMLNYELKEWIQVVENLQRALIIETHQKTYINEIFAWNETIYDLLSIAYFNLGAKKLSLEYINKALKLAPDNERLINNKNIISGL